MGAVTCEVHSGWNNGLYQCNLFDIGIGRVGSRSICQAARELGIRSKHGFNGCKACHDDAVHKYLWGRCDFDIYRTCEYSGDISSFHWKELAEFYPKAKFILPVRPIDSWMESLSYKTRVRGCIEKHERAIEKPIEWVHLLLLHVFGRIVWEHDTWLNGYQKYVGEVMETLDKSRLLILDVFEMGDDELWEKLCAFLDKPIPNIPFPHFTRRCAHLQSVREKV